MSLTRLVKVSLEREAQEMVDVGEVSRKMHLCCGAYPDHRDSCSVWDEAPGVEGRIGPGRGQYNFPHVYARDVQSGAGNCVCGSSLGNAVHLQAAPGVFIPHAFRY